MFCNSCCGGGSSWVVGKFSALKQKGGILGGHLCPGRCVCDSGLYCRGQYSLLYVVCVVVGLVGVL